MNLPLQRSRAEQHLPSAPLLQGDLATSELERWEVVLAYNLEPPYRFRQDYWWLEVLAENSLAARGVAWEWVRRNPDTRFECTEWVRAGGPHPSSLASPEGDTLRIIWQIPLPEHWPAATPVRNPATGKRIGFVDPRSDRDFALIRHLPSSRADLICFLPKVTDLSLRRLSL